MNIIQRDGTRSLMEFTVAVGVGIPRVWIERYRFNYSYEHKFPRDQTGLPTEFVPFSG